MSFYTKDRLGELKSREPQTPAQIEAAKAKAKLAAVKLTEAPWLDCSEKNLYEAVKMATYNMKITEEDDASRKIKFLRYDDDIGKKIISIFQRLGGPEQVAVAVKYFKTLEELAKATLEAEKIDRETRTALDNSFLDGRDAGIAFAEKAISERRADQILQAELKRQPSRIFSEAEKAKGIDWQSLPLEALEESRQRLLDKKVPPRKKIAGLDGQISKFRKEIAPFNERIFECQAKLDQDPSEAEFKNSKLTIEFLESKINKILSKITSVEEEKTALQNEIDQIDSHVAILDCCVDKRASENEVKNWQNRRKRALERVYKVLNDRDGLIQLRISLNEKWKSLTNDPVELIHPLTLRADDQMFFI